MTDFLFSFQKWSQPTGGSAAGHNKKVDRNSGKCSWPFKDLLSHTFFPILIHIHSPCEHHTWRHVSTYCMCVCVCRFLCVEFENRMFFIGFIYLLLKIGNPDSGCVRLRHVFMPKMDLKKTCWEFVWNSWDDNYLVSGEL